MKRKCLAITGDIFARHEMELHNECSTRLRMAISCIPESVELIDPYQASAADLEAVHKPHYIRMIRELCALGGKRYIDMDTYLTAETYEVASFAAGSAINAIERTLGGEHCFALVRPPGHHAEPDKGMGFCIFNNVAVAVAHALGKVKKIAIIDWDLHHGNGTQKMFYPSDQVLFCSIHQANSFPRTGWVDEIGTGNGRGYTLNAPILEGATLQDYLYIFNRVILPALESFSPDAVIVSSGLDPLYDDPIGGINLQPDDFGVLTDLLASAVKPPIALVLEGGYGPSLGLAVRSIFNALEGDCPEFKVGEPKESTKRVVSQLSKLTSW
jgi:acetoin utilization deacetylase AcuC-like enzyme